MNAKSSPPPSPARRTPTSRATVGLELLPLVLGLVLTGAGCFLDPTCSDSCDGDKISSCEWQCSGSGKLDVDECHRRYGGTDCAQQTGWSGKPLGCRMLTVVNSDPRPACIDVSTTCEHGVDAPSCVGSQYVTCQATAEGGYFQAADGSARCE